MNSKHSTPFAMQYQLSGVFRTPAAANISRLADSALGELRKSFQQLHNSIGINQSLLLSQSSAMRQESNPADEGEVLIMKLKTVGEKVQKITLLFEQIKAQMAQQNSAQFDPDVLAKFKVFQIPGLNASAQLEAFMTQLQDQCAQKLSLIIGKNFKDFHAALQYLQSNKPQSRDQTAQYFTQAIQMQRQCDNLQQQVEQYASQVASLEEKLQNQYTMHSNYVKRKETEGEDANRHLILRIQELEAELAQLQAYQRFQDSHTAHVATVQTSPSLYLQFRGNQLVKSESVDAVQPVAFGSTQTQQEASELPVQQLLKQNHDNIQELCDLKKAVGQLEQLLQKQQNVDGELQKRAQGAEQQFKKTIDQYADENARLKSQIASFADKIRNLVGKPLQTDTVDTETNIQKLNKWLDDLSGFSELNAQIRKIGALVSQEASGIKQITRMHIEQIGTLAVGTGDSVADIRSAVARLIEMHANASCDARNRSAAFVHSSERVREDALAAKLQINTLWRELAACRAHVTEANQSVPRAFSDVECAFAAYQALMTQCFVTAELQAKARENTLAESVSQLKSQNAQLLQRQQEVERVCEGADLFTVLGAWNRLKLEFSEPDPDRMVAACMSERQSAHLVRQQMAELQELLPASQGHSQRVALAREQQVRYLQYETAFAQLAAHLNVSGADSPQEIVSAAQCVTAQLQQAAQELQCAPDALLHGIRVLQQQNQLFARQVEQQQHDKETQKSLSAVLGFSTHQDAVEQLKTLQQTIVLMKPDFCGIFDTYAHALQQISELFAAECIRTTEVNVALRTASAARETASKEAEAAIERERCVVAEMNALQERIQLADDAVVRAEQACAAQAELRQSCEKTLQSVTDGVRRAHARVEQLSAENETLRRTALQKTDADSEMQRLRDERDELLRDVQSAVQTREALESAIVQAKSEAARAAGVSASQASEIQRIVAQNGELQRVVKSLNADLQNASLQTADARKQARIRENQLSCELQQLQAENVRIESELHAAQAQLQEANAQIAQLTEERRGKHAELLKMLEEKKELIAQRAVLQDSLTKYSYTPPDCFETQALRDEIQRLNAFIDQDRLTSSAEHKASNSTIYDVKSVKALLFDIFATEEDQFRKGQLKQAVDKMANVCFNLEFNNDVQALDNSEDLEFSRMLREKRAERCLPGFFAKEEEMTIHLLSNAK